MRLLRWLVPLLLLIASIVLVSQPGAWKYLAVLCASLGGMGVMAVGLYSVYSADQHRLKQSVRGLKPLRDYGSLRAMAYRLMNRASSTAIASAEVSHYADLMAQRLGK
ncbi:MAG: methyl-accepting chemotaxis protein, partial [Pseudomonadota bacterium]|nr:methyl-accepting chemotaxis protein [Pseudomonadota bacterium]